MDGGSSGWNTNIISAIEKCRELGVTADENIILDVIMLDAADVKKMEKPEEETTIHFYAQIHSIKSYYPLVNDMVEFMRANPKI